MNYRGYTVCDPLTRDMVLNVLTRGEKTTVCLNRHITLNTVHRWINDSLLSNGRPKSRRHAQLLAAIEMMMVKRSGDCDVESSEPWLRLTKELSDGR